MGYFKFLHTDRPLYDSAPYPLQYALKKILQKKGDCVKNQTAIWQTIYEGKRHLPDLKPTFTTEGLLFINHGFRLSYILNSLIKYLFQGSSEYKVNVRKINQSKKKNSFDFKFESS